MYTYIDMYTHTPALRNLLFDASAVPLKFIIDEKTMFLSVPGSPPSPPVNDLGSCIFCSRTTQLRTRVARNSPGFCLLNINIY